MKTRQTPPESHNFSCSEHYLDSEAYASSKSQMLTHTPERIRSGERAKDYFAQVVSEIALALRDIESAIDRIDAKLDLLQPAHTGRIRVMWVSRGKARGYEDEKTPIAVRWSRHRLRGVWSAKRLPLASLMLRAKSSGDFESHTSEVRDLLTHLQVLLDMHAKTRARFAKLDGDWARAHPQVTRRLQEVLQQI